MIKPKPLPAKFKFKELQQKIIKKYRPLDSPETSPFPTFPEFVQHIIDFTKDFVSAEDWRSNVGVRVRRLAVFSEREEGELLFFYLFCFLSLCNVGFLREFMATSFSSRVILMQL